MKKKKQKKKRMGGILLRGTKVVTAKKGKGSYRRDNNIKKYPDDIFLC